MPESQSAVVAIQEQALRDADLFLVDNYGALRVGESDFVASAAGRFRAGWSILIQPSTRRMDLHVYVDSSFPFSRPTFVLVDRPDFLTWPHVEKSGKLCLLDDVRITHPELVEDVLRSEITDAFRLIQESEAGTNQEDFQHEFHSYWNRQEGLSDRSVFSLLSPAGESRLVQFWNGKHWCVAGETEEQIAIWLKHRHGEKAEHVHSDLACLIWLPTPLLPREYPRTGADLYNLAARANGAAQLLRRLAVHNDPPFPLLFGSDSKNGPCFAAALSYHPKRTDTSGASRPKTRPGFRPGNVPPTLQTQHLFSADARIEAMEVERVDAAWVHGRGHDPRQKILAEKHVVLAGCGSVGAPLAQQLAMAGVGRLTLVDPDILDWANIGRHPLGSKYINRPKAGALSEFLQENLPHLQIDGFVGTLAEYFETRPGNAMNLVISATANWNAERVLNLDHIHGQIACPVLFTWTERHACAGHAVFMPTTRPCLQCGFTLGGDMQHPVTDWPEEMPSHLSEPACGAIFQPYGPIELMGTVAVAASLTLDALLGKVVTATHRIWVGPRSLLVDAGGSWNPKWLSEHLDRNEGAFQETILWQEDHACCACGQLRSQPSSSILASQASN